MPISGSRALRKLGHAVPGYRGLRRRGRPTASSAIHKANELILTDAPIEISGFSLDQIDQIILGDGEGAEKGPLAPESDLVAVARLGHIFTSVSIALFAGTPPIQQRFGRRIGQFVARQSAWICEKPSQRHITILARDRADRQAPQGAE
jgi:hypothetical protein